MLDLDKTKSFDISFICLFSSEFFFMKMDLLNCAENPMSLSVTKFDLFLFLSSLYLISNLVSLLGKNTEAYRTQPVILLCSLSVCFILAENSNTNTGNAIGETD